LAKTAKQSRFKEAALLAQETKAAEEEGESQAMLLFVVQNLELRTSVEWL
jgi:hypothetical protein